MKESTLYVILVVVIVFAIVFALRPRYYFGIAPPPEGEP